MAFPSLSFTVFDLYITAGFTLQGKVKDQSGNAIANVHVYTVSGEEETFCNRDGSFSLKTHNGLPVVVIANHPDYFTKKITVEDTLNILQLQLQHK